MKFRNILVVYRKELKDSLRDRRTLISTIIVPTLVMPLLMLGVGKIMGRVMAKAREEIPAVMVLGGEDSPSVVARMRAAPRLKVVPATADWQERIADKKVRAAVRLPTGFEAGLNGGGTAEVTIYHYEGELKSSLGARELENFLRELREQHIAGRLAERSLPPTLARPFELRRENVAPPEKVGGNLFGGLVPYVIIILCFTGAIYPAIDLTAGEKERGTMETLLCSPVARRDIVLGKFLMVLTGSLSAMVFMLVSLAVTAAIGGALLMGGGAGAVAAAGQGGANAMPAIDPLGLLGVLAMVLPVSVLFSAVAFTVALFAKSYKEAQSYLAPMMIVIVLPAMIGLLPGIDLNVRLAVVPLVNLALVCKEMLSGVWNWNYILLIFGSSCIYAALALVLAVRMFKREDVLFRT